MSDLRVPHAREVELRALVTGEHILAFHSTRLLDHEVTAIREQGLRMLSRELIEERIAGAHSRGFLTDEERERHLAENVFARGEAEGREGKVCLTIGRTVFDHVGSGCQPLLEAWGGEGTNGGAFGDQDDLRIGRPAIVVARLNLTESEPELCITPSLGALLVGTVLETEQRWSEVHLYAPIASADVLDIWQPGHPEYDRHGGIRN